MYSVTEIALIYFSVYVMYIFVWVGGGCYNCVFPLLKNVIKGYVFFFFKD